MYIILFWSKWLLAMVYVDDIVKFLKSPHEHIIQV